jgi:hypothetical protein
VALETAITSGLTGSKNTNKQNTFRLCQLPARDVFIIRGYPDTAGHYAAKNQKEMVDGAEPPARRSHAEIWRILAGDLGCAEREWRPFFSAVHGAASQSTLSCISICRHPVPDWHLHPQDRWVNIRKKAIREGAVPPVARSAPARRSPLPPASAAAISRERAPVLAAARKRNRDEYKSADSRPATMQPAARPEESSDSPAP